MKNLVLSSRVHLLLGISAALLGFESRAFAQEGQGVFITQAAARLSKLVDKGNKDKFNLQNNTFSIGGGWLKKGDAWVGIYTVQLEQGKAYRFLAAGDDDAKDVDLRLMDLKGKMEYAVDDRDDAEAVVNFTPKMSGRYLVQIRLYSSRKDFDAVCLSVVMQK
jgi:hypothetical protein